MYEISKEQIYCYLLFNYIFINFINKEIYFGVFYLFIHLFGGRSKTMCHHAQLSSVYTNDQMKYGYKESIT